MKNISKEELIKKIIKIIDNNYGSITASMYKDYYKDKNEEEIISSCKEFLSELVGPKNAYRQIKKVLR